MVQIELGSAVYCRMSAVCLHFVSCSMWITCKLIKKTKIKCTLECPKLSNALTYNFGHLIFFYLPRLFLFGPKTEIAFVFWSFIFFVLLSLRLFRFRGLWCLFAIFSGFFSWFNHSMANKTCSRVQMRHLKITYLTLILIRSIRWTYLYKTAKTFIGQATPSGTNDEQIADWCSK